MRYKQVDFKIQRSYTNNCVQHTDMRSFMRSFVIPPRRRRRAARRRCAQMSAVPCLRVSTEIREWNMEGSKVRRRGQPPRRDATTKLKNALRTAVQRGPGQQCNRRRSRNQDPNGRKGGGVTDAQAAESLRGLPGDERVVVEGRRGRVEREALGLEVEHGLPVARERRLHEAAGRDGERELVHAGRDRERLRGRVRGREGDLAGRRSENDRPHLVLELLTRKSPLARAYHMIVKEGTYELEVGGCTEAVSGGNRVLGVRARPHHNLVLLDSRGLTGLERGREEVHEAQPCLMVKAVDPRL